MSALSPADATIAIQTARSWQFHVMPLGSLVLKIPKSHRQTVVEIQRSRWSEELDAKGVDMLACEVRRNARCSMGTVWCKRPAHSLCGKPIRLPGVGYVQIRGTTFLRAYQSGCWPAKRIIDDYFNLTTSLWQHGLFEMSFDFLRNSGYLPNGRSFQLDLGDFTADYVQACEVLAQQRWMTRLDLAALKPGEQAYFIECSTQYFTRGNFDALWGMRT